MEEKSVYKMFYRKADEHLNGTVIAKHGKRDNQKLSHALLEKQTLLHSDVQAICSGCHIVPAAA